MMQLTFGQYRFLHSSGSSLTITSVIANAERLFCQNLAKLCLAFRAMSLSHAMIFALHILASYKTNDRLRVSPCRSTSCGDSTSQVVYFQDLARKLETNGRNKALSLDCRIRVIIYSIFLVHCLARDNSLSTRASACVSITELQVLQH